MAKSEEKELREGLLRAINDNDGYLAHYYGSQLTHREQTKKHFERERLIMKQKMKDLKAESFLKIQLQVDDYKLKRDIMEINAFKDATIFLGVTFSVLIFVVYFFIECL